MTFGDPALPVVDRDHVAEPDRLVEQDREARDVVGRELLQAEADADAERAAEHREQRQVEADRLQRDQHADDEQERAHELARARRACWLSSAVAADEALLEEARQPQRDDQRERPPRPTPFAIVSSETVALPIGSTTASSSRDISGSTPTK